MVRKTRKNMHGGRQTHPDLIVGQRYRVYSTYNPTSFILKGKYLRTENDESGSVPARFVYFSDVTTPSGHYDTQRIIETMLYMYEFEPIEDEEPSVGGRRRKHRKATRKNKRKASRK